MLKSSKLAAHVESAKLMGVKNRALAGNRKKQSRLLIGGLGVQFVEDAVNKGIMHRRRRFLNLPVVEQLAKKALREWVEAHGDVVCGGRVFQASKTWCRHFFVEEGLGVEEEVAQTALAAGRERESFAEVSALVAFGVEGWTYCGTVGGRRSRRGNRGRVVRAQVETETIAATVVDGRGA